DANTLKAIREFQKRFMASPDGVVNTDNRTLYHLNNAGAPTYKGCSVQQRRTVDRNFIEAQKWLDLVLRELGAPGSAETKRKVRNVFHVNVDDPTDAGHLMTLRGNFR